MKMTIAALVTLIGLSAQAKQKTLNYQTEVRRGSEACAQITEITVQDSQSHYQPELQFNDQVELKYADGSVTILKYQYSSRRHDSDVGAHALEVYGNEEGLSAVMERNSDYDYPRPHVTEGFSDMELFSYQRVDCSYTLIRK